MSFLQFGVWGAYLISMGTFLFSAGMGDKIGYFYAMQGVVALFMPALMGIVADRWIPAQKLLAVCHLLSALFKSGMAYVACSAIQNPAQEYPTLIILYAFSVAFFIAIPNLAARKISTSLSLSPIKIKSSNVLLKCFSKASAPSFLVIVVLYISPK